MIFTIDIEDAAVVEGLAYRAGLAGLSIEAFVQRVAVDMGSAVARANASAPVDQTIVLTGLARKL